MEPLGKKLQQARLAKNISLEEASRVTKIRPSRIEEIEAEDFSSFPSLAYAKGFLIIYGKFLDVDVTPYLEAFETSDRMTVDGYSYLQGEGGGVPPSPIVRRQPAKRPALLPLFIAVGVLVVGLYLMKLFLDIQRIVPPEGRAAASATPSPESIVAPRAIPVEETPRSAPMPSSSPLATATAKPPPTEPEVRRAQPVHPEDLAPSKTTPPPNVADLTVPAATPVLKEAATTAGEGFSSAEKGSSLAEKGATVTEKGATVAEKGATVTEKGAIVTEKGAIVSKKGATVAEKGATSPEEGASLAEEAALTATEPSPSPNIAAATPKPSPSSTPAPIGRVQITPVRKTFLRVIVDNNAAHPAFEGWLAPSDPPLSFRAQHVSVRAFERGAIQITRNGTPVRSSDANVHLE